MPRIPKIHHWPNGLGCDISSVEIMLQLVNGGRLRAVALAPKDGGQRVCLVPYPLTHAMRSWELDPGVLRAVAEYTRTKGTTVDPYDAGARPSWQLIVQLSDILSKTPDADEPGGEHGTSCNPVADACMGL
jgi:hypothetical protein